MKKCILLLTLLLLTPAISAQNGWNFKWKLNQKPFQDPMVASQMGIVKAGFDTDQDGKGEFLCAYTDMGENYLLMYEATDDGDYELVWYWKYPVPANTFAGIAVGDIDNNGKVDIITTMPSQVTITPNPPRLWVFEWNGVVGENKYGVYEPGVEMPEPTAEWNLELPDNIDFRPYSLIIEDIDGDGDNELIVGVRQGGRGREVIVASVTGELSGFGSFEIEYNLQGLTGGSLYSVTTGDLDGDGKKEIHAMIWDFFSLYMIENTAPDQYELLTSLPRVFVDTQIDYGALDGIVVADVNEDGINEMYIAGTESPNQLFIITNVTDIAAITPQDIKPFYRIPQKGLGRLRTLSVVDTDGDGNLSLMIAGERNGQIFELKYKGEGDPADSTSWDLIVAFDIFEYSGFSPDDNPTIEPRLFYGSFAGDMDGNGKMEYVFVNYRTSFFTATNDTLFPDDAYVWVIEKDAAPSNVNTGNMTPRNFELSQNFPNPFNPITRISYQLAREEFVSLKVYDVLGKEVSTLVSDKQGAGKYTVNFNASNLPSGLYLYRLEAGNYISSKKMILLK